MSTVIEVVLIFGILMICMVVGWVIGSTCTKCLIELTKDERNTIKDAQFWLIESEEKPDDEVEYRKIALELLEIIERQNDE